MASETYYLDVESLKEKIEEERVPFINPAYPRTLALDIGCRRLSKSIYSKNLKVDFSDSLLNRQKEVQLNNKMQNWVNDEVFIYGLNRILLDFQITGKVEPKQRMTDEELQLLRTIKIKICKSLKVQYYLKETHKLISK